MKSPAHELALYLASNGLGTFAGPSGWAINVSREPDVPDNAITLYDTGGTGDTDDDRNLFLSLIQVRVRSKNYADAYAKHQEIFPWLVNPTPIIGETVRFCAIVMRSDILSLGRDDNDRHLLTANYEVLREPL